MKLFLSIQTFYVLFVIACNFLEINGKGGARGGSSGSRGGGSRGGSGGSSSGRGSYGSRSSSSGISGSKSGGKSFSSGRSSYRSLSGGKYRSSYSGDHESPNHNPYRSISSGKNYLRGDGYGSYVNPIHHNRINGGSAGLVRNNTVENNSSKIQIHHANTVVTERSTTKTWRFDNYRPKTTPYSPPLYWNDRSTTAQPTEYWNRMNNRRKIDEPTYPYHLYWNDRPTTTPSTEYWNWMNNRRKIDEPTHPYHSELDNLDQMNEEIRRLQSIGLRCHDLQLSNGIKK